VADQPVDPNGETPEVPATQPGAHRAPTPESWWPEEVSTRPPAPIRSEEIWSLDEPSVEIPPLPEAVIDEPLVDPEVLPADFDYEPSAPIPVVDNTTDESWWKPSPSDVLFGEAPPVDPEPLVESIEEPDPEQFDLFAEPEAPASYDVSDPIGEHPMPVEPIRHASIADDVDATAEYDWRIVEPVATEPPTGQVIVGAFPSWQSTEEPVMPIATTDSVEPAVMVPEFEVPPTLAPEEAVDSDFVADELAVGEPVVDELVADEPVVAEFLPEEPVVIEPDEPMLVEPVLDTVEPAVDVPDAEVFAAEAIDVPDLAVDEPASDSASGLNAGGLAAAGLGAAGVGAAGLGVAMQEFGATPIGELSLDPVATPPALENFAFDPAAPVEEFESAFKVDSVVVDEPVIEAPEADLGHYLDESRPLLGDPLPNNDWWAADNAAALGLTEALAPEVPEMEIPEVGAAGVEAPVVEAPVLEAPTAIEEPVVDTAVAGTAIAAAAPSAFDHLRRRGLAGQSTAPSAPDESAVESDAADELTTDVELVADDLPVDDGAAAGLAVQEDTEAVAPIEASSGDVVIAEPSDDDDGLPKPIPGVEPQEWRDDAGLRWLSYDGGYVWFGDDGQIWNAETGEVLREATAQPEPEAVVADAAAPAVAPVIDDATARFDPIAEPVAEPTESDVELSADVPSVPLATETAVMAPVAAAVGGAAAAGGVVAAASGSTAAYTEIPEYVEYTPRRRGRTLLIVVFILLALAAVAAIFWAASKGGQAPWGVAAGATGLTLAAWWALLNWVPQVVAVDKALLSVTKGAESERFNLDDPDLDISVDDPSKPDWAATITRPDGSSLRIDGNSVHAEEFSAIVKHYRG